MLEPLLIGATLVLTINIPGGEIRNIHAPFEFPSQAKCEKYAPKIVEYFTQHHEGVKVTKWTCEPDGDDI